MSGIVVCPVGVRVNGFADVAEVLTSAVAYDVDAEDVAMNEPDGVLAEVLVCFVDVRIVVLFKVEVALKAEIVCSFDVAMIDIFIWSVDVTVVDLV